MVSHGGYLQLKDVRLAATGEWTPPAGGWCFVRVESGQGYWLGQPTVHELGPGDGLIISGDDPGTLRASRLGLLRLQYFQFSPEVLTGFLTMSERQQFETAQRTPGVRRLPAGETLARQFNALATEATTAHPLFLRCKLVELVAAALAEEMREPTPESVRHASATDRFIRLIHPMSDSELIQHTPGELATLCGCSLRHFSRLFRQQFGMSIRSKQTELRIARARQLLLDPASKIVHVALESGYRHLGLFNATFKRRLGMTPTEWRRQHLAPSPVAATTGGVSGTPGRAEPAGTRSNTTGVSES